MTYLDIYFDKDKTKFSHELCQILDEVTHGGPAPDCLWKLRPYVVGPVCVPRRSMVSCWWYMSMTACMVRFCVRLNRP